MYAVFSRSKLVKSVKNKSLYMFVKICVYLCVFVGYIFVLFVDMRYLKSRLKMAKVFFFDVDMKPCSMSRN